MAENNSELVLAIQTRDDKISNLKNSLVKKDERIRSLLGQVSAYRSELDVVRSQSNPNVLGNCIASLEASSYAKAQELREANHNIASLEAAMEKLARSKEAALSEKADIETAMKDLQLIVENQQIAICKKEDQIAQASAEVSRLQAELAQIENHSCPVDQAAMDPQETEHLRLILEQDLAAKTSEVDLLKKELELVIDQKSSLESEVSSKSDLVKSLDADLDEIPNQKSDLEALLVARSDAVLSLEKRLIEVEGQRSVLESVVTTSLMQDVCLAKSELAAKSAEVLALQEELRRVELVLKQPKDVVQGKFDGFPSVGPRFGLLVLVKL